jgi:FKBP-type peptidyl-prolyl cis-trans isomerase FklB
VHQTPTGLQYEILQAGTGNKPGPTTMVTVHYEGKLIDGTVFDSSFKRNQPATFGLHQVIPGWTEGVQLMNEGATFRFYIPYELGYGARGAGGAIPPYATLIFDVQLIKVG